eukprot:6204727-Pleurochrysis_carterae.AAC.1
MVFNFVATGNTKKKTCRSDASDRAPGDIPHFPPSADSAYRCKPADQMHPIGPREISHISLHQRTAPTAVI